MSVKQLGLSFLCCLLASQVSTVVGQASQPKQVALAIHVDSRGMAPGKQPVKQAFILDSSSDTHREWEQLLSDRSPADLGDVKTMADFVAELRELGLPVVLTQSAREDLLTEDEQVVLEELKAPLRSLLLDQLHKYNATICFSEHTIRIISRDDVFENDFLQTKIYDITRITEGQKDLESLVDNIHESIVPDSWATTQGVGTMVVREFNGRRLCTVTQTYETHRKLKRYLEAVAALSGIEGDGRK